MSHHGEDEHEDQTGPAEDTDPATKADLGLGGTPDEAYSPEGMDDGADADEDGGTYQPEDEDDEG
ncbi:MAG: hypothetical protein KY461_00115 [Actinobacteria bacterium]|nr:hypothetical protein [Actinomycetota bacterium]